MAGRFEGKVALVTGGASGIGAATVRRLRSEGARVAIGDLAEATGAALAEDLAGQDGGAAFFAVDVAEQGQVERLVAAAAERFGRLDVLVNNAGIGSFGETPELDPEQWHRVIAVDLHSVFYACRAAIPHLRRAGGGAIVNTASVAGLIGAPFMPAYCASKHGVLGLTKAAAAEYGRHKIRVNAVCPGVIDTPMMERAFEADPRRRPQMERLHLLRRVGEAQEVANAVLWLSSDAASFVTGHPMAVDGGMVAV